jgi:hypothetical protein
MHPHSAQWRLLSGLVVDGANFTRQHVGAKLGYGEPTGVGVATGERLLPNDPSPAAAAATAPMGGKGAVAIKQQAPAPASSLDDDDLVE